MIPDDIEEPGRKKALAFTILVHAGLIAALILGVQWKRSQPDAVEVELWSSSQLPAVRVAPAPPPPPETRPEPKPEPKPVPKVEPKPEPPPPVKPDIAIKEEKKPPKPERKQPEPEPKKPEPPKPEPKKPEPSKPEPKKPEPSKQEVKTDPNANYFSEMLKREATERSPRPNNSQQMNKLAAAEAEQRAAAGKKGLQDYAAKIRGKIRGNIVLPPNIQGNPEAIFDVNQLPGGEVLEVRLRKSSGNSSLDAAIERAIRKSSPLPAPDDPTLFRRDLEIKYKPIEE
ncbi:MAG: energy transducer TonB [Azonexus sp.]